MIDENSSIRGCPVYTGYAGKPSDHGENKPQGRWAWMVGQSRLFVCLFFPRSQRKKAWAINTKLGTHVLLYSSRSTCIESGVKRSRLHNYKNCHGCYRDACCYSRKHQLPADPADCIC